MTDEQGPPPEEVQTRRICARCVRQYETLLQPNESMPLHSYCHQCRKLLTIGGDFIDGWKPLPDLRGSPRPSAFHPRKSS